MDDSLDGAGAVYVFTRTAESWSQQAYVKASNTDPHDSFGGRMALNFDGNTLAIAAPAEQGMSPGIGGDQTFNGPATGAVYLY